MVSLQFFHKIFKIFLVKKEKTIVNINEPIKLNLTDSSWNVYYIWGIDDSNNYLETTFDNIVSTLKSLNYVKIDNPVCYCIRNQNQV